MDNTDNKKAFVCGRCGFEARREANLIGHFGRKFTCRPVLSNKTTDELHAEFLRDKNAGKADWASQCTACGERLRNKFALYRHRKNKCPGSQAHAPTTTPTKATASTATASSDAVGVDETTVPNMDEIYREITELKREINLEKKMDALAAQVAELAKKLAQ